MVQRNNIGIILPVLDNSQLTFMAINEIGYLSNITDDFAIFYEELGLPCLRPSCGMFNISHLSNFHGTLISTNLSSTEIMLKTVNASKKIFYVWELEWFDKRKNFIENVNIYRNPNIKLVTRSEEYARFLENYTNREVGIVDHFNIRKIINA